MRTLKLAAVPQEAAHNVGRITTPHAIKTPLLRLQAATARLSSILGGPSIAGGHVEAADALLASMARDIAEARAVLR